MYVVVAINVGYNVLVGWLIERMGGMRKQECGNVNNYNGMFPL